MGEISSSQNYTQTFWDWFLRIRIETKQSGTRRVPAGTVSSQMLQEHFSESASHSRRPMPKGQAASKTDLNLEQNYDTDSMIWCANTIKYMWHTQLYHCPQALIKES